ESAMYQQSLSSSDIVNRLRGLCQDKQTGTLYIIENGHLLGQISLQAGEIIALLAQKKQGLHALPLFVDIQNGGVAFAPGPLSTPRMALPSTHDILAILDGANTAADLHQAEAKQAGAKPAAPALSQASKTILEELLKEFIGPIAVMICADCFQVAAAPDAAVNALAEEIPNPQAAAQFQQRARLRLGL
ncbi:MAG TPA: hypothetical protein PLP22_09135, partial [Candidatus Competibacter sp.]|nr:hypothetical protein [Candidatus Competibacter sp.]